MPVDFPPGFLIDDLRKSHDRKSFASGQPKVDDWLRTKALQHQEKNLSRTKVLIEGDRIAGFFTLAFKEIDYQDMPEAITRHLPRKALPVILLGWFGIDRKYQKRGLGRDLIRYVLLELLRLYWIVPAIATIIDCIDDDSKNFFQQFDFDELPGRPYRLYLSTADLIKLDSD